MRDEKNRMGFQLIHGCNHGCGCRVCLYWRVLFSCSPIKREVIKTRSVFFSLHFADYEFYLVSVGNVVLTDHSPTDIAMVLKVLRRQMLDLMSHHHISFKSVCWVLWARKCLICGKLKTFSGRNS